MLLAFTAFSCNKGYEYQKVETVYADVHITHVAEYKYSKVEGYIIYNNIILNVDNGNSGYYHKKYSLKKGDVVKRNVTVFHQINYDKTTLYSKEVDFYEYELKN